MIVKWTINIDNKELNYRGTILEIRDCFSRGKYLIVNCDDGHIRRVDVKDVEVEK